MNTSSILKEPEITTRLSSTPHWQYKEHESEIFRVFKFSDFKEAIAFVNGVAVLAEKASHHPNIIIQWNRVTLSLSTHSQGGLTQKDFDLASQIDTIIP